MNVCDYSTDGRHIATGGEDGKVSLPILVYKININILHPQQQYYITLQVKVWETRTSFCFVTFSDHTSSVTGVCFTQNGNAVVSSSLDGTVRAFDLTRYFRLHFSICIMIYSNCIVWLELHCYA